jgi:hypothetical protein
MKRNDWLMAQTFERTQELLGAISNLSVQAKLRLKGITDRMTEADLKAARTVVSAFLSRLENLYNEAQKTQTGIIIGSDPELGLLAKRLLGPSARASTKAVSGTEFLHQLKTDIESGEKADLNRLIEGLRELRQVVEEYAHADVTAVLGDV